jgi:hypothetical protein
MGNNSAPNGLAQHPLSSAFPSMSPLDFSELVNDIRGNGVQHPITIFEGMVLDGWHRYLACQQIRCECPSVLFTGKDPVRFVLSLNLNHRHMTGSQRAEAVVACNAWAPSGRPKGDVDLRYLRICHPQEYASDKCHTGQFL